MKFRVTGTGTTSIPHVTEDIVYLIEDQWNDWWEYRTQYHAFLARPNGQNYRMGDVKIGRFGLLGESYDRPDLPGEFENLSEEYFSLGQGVEYYENVYLFGEQIRNEILVGLQDLAFAPDRIPQVYYEKVGARSIFRSVPVSTARQQYSRVARGGAVLTSYEFSYEDPEQTGLSLEFVVQPESQPPSNIHVLIGRNGVGKTTLLESMTRALVSDKAPTTSEGFFRGETSDEDLFANLISVTFSAFDDSRPALAADRDQTASLIGYSYVGLKKIIRPLAKDADSPEVYVVPKSPDDLADEFQGRLDSCSRWPHVGRWNRAISMLGADPIFEEEVIDQLTLQEVTSDTSRYAVLERGKAIFQKLSSGHKIVLLTVACLVQRVEERSLILVDEPEAHLHPPLLSALIRSVSDLLINRNGVALVATHSPVILQEVPRTCVYRLRRFGDETSADRPQIETYGENVGELTREVFGLELTRSGFHEDLRRAVLDGMSYEQILDRFSYKLGGEAKAIARTLVDARDAGEEI